uniref:Uncharacterized protein n=1 Tax=Timema cristinae TaxID=61476 RepID=A0A7R9GPD2_TIMCR|nr:unnamed protein product [Timema cristinae]
MAFAGKDHISRPEWSRKRERVYLLYVTLTVSTSSWEVSSVAAWSKALISPLTRLPMTGRSCFDPSRVY